MSPRRLMFLLCACLGMASLQGAAPPATNAPGLTERQMRVLNGVARGRFGGSWVSLTLPQLEELQRRSEAYSETINRWHLHGGLVTSVRFADTNRNRIVSLEDAQLGAIQTGYLLAAYAFRYSVQIENRNLTAISNLLNGVEQLLKDGPKPGFIPRFVGPADSPTYQAFYSKFGGPDPDHPGLGKLARVSKGTKGSEGNSRVWLAGSGRDDYTAINFGLGLVYSRVRDPAIRDRSGRALRQILSRLSSDSWRIDDGGGNPIFVDPLLQSALLSSGTLVESRTYGSLYKTNVTQLLEQTDLRLLRYSDYTANVSQFANYLLLALLEKGNSVQNQFRDRLSRLWRDAEPDLNPFLASMFASAFGDVPNNAGTLSTIQGILYLFPPPPRIGTPSSTVPDLVRLSANGREWSRNALPVSVQPVAPFQWMQSPYELPRATDPTVEHPGVDFLVTYWTSLEASALRPEQSTVRKSKDTNSLILTNLPTAPITAPKLSP